MKSWFPFYILYTCIIALPLIIVSTVITSILTLILSPLLPNNKTSYIPAIVWGRFCCHVLLIRVKISGLQNIDKNRSYIVTPNHQSIFDILAVYGWLPLIFKWMMKKELREVPFIGSACEAAGHIFVDRESPVAAKNSLIKAAEQLINGNSTVIFPEGTRTKTGKVGKFKRGAFLLAIELQLPIIPITIKGSYERFRNKFIYPGVIEMKIHPPVDVHSFSIENSSDLVRQVQEIVKSGL